MEWITKSPGLWNILEQILANLDPKSLKNAALVCQTWNHISKGVKKEVLTKYLSQFKSKQSWFFKQWPEWSNILEDFIQNRSDEDIEKLIKILENHFNPDAKPYKYLNQSILERMCKRRDPLMIAAEIDNNISAFELILPSVKNLNSKDPIDGKTVLHLAITNGRSEIVKLLLQYGDKIDFQAKDNLGNTIFDEAYNQMISESQMTFDHFQGITFYNTGHCDIYNRIFWYANKHRINISFKDTNFEIIHH